MQTVRTNFVFGCDSDDLTVSVTLRMEWSKFKPWTGSLCLREELVDFSLRPGVYNGVY